MKTQIILEFTNDLDCDTFQEKVVEKALEIDKVLGKA